MLNLSSELDVWVKVKLRCCFLLWDLSRYSWQRSLICHHIPQLKGKGERVPVCQKRVPVSHVKLKSTHINIIEPLREHKHSTMMSGWPRRWFVFPLLVSPGFFILSSINHFLFSNCLYRYFAVQMSQPTSGHYLLFDCIFGHVSSTPLWKTKSCWSRIKYLNKYQWICISLTTSTITQHHVICFKSLRVLIFQGSDRTPNPLPGFTQEYDKHTGLINISILCCHTTLTQSNIFGIFEEFSQVSALWYDLFELNLT